MKTKQILKNVIITSIIGILLGAITEYALILNINWLVKITQTFIFWGIIICLASFLSKEYMYAIMNPIILMSCMNATYYLIRLAISGYTNIGGLKLFMFTGIAGSIYIGTFIYILKKKLVKHEKSIFYEICNFIFMTIIGVIFTLVGFRKAINHNLFYNIDIGIIIGFFIGIIINKINKKKSKLNNKNNI